MTAVEAHIRALELIHKLSHAEDLHEVLVILDNTRQEDEAGEVLVSVFSQCLNHMEAYATLLGLSFCEYIEASKKKATSQWN